MRIPVAVLLGLCASPALAADPIAPGIPWARQAHERVARDFAGATAPLSAEALVGVEGHWEGDMYFGPDGMPADAFTQLGRAPEHAMAYEPTVGILYLAMGGVSLSSSCGGGDVANAAKNCSPLVTGEVDFPAYGNGSAQASLFQELANYYEPFNLVMTAERPPDWLPYTMAVVGGSAAQAGLGGGVCGVANVACDGLKRNHVSLTFPESCGGVAETAAQETSHNWGLEHVNDTQDLMYPFNNGGFKTFKDECNPIDHSTGGGTTQCGYIHEIYCGEEQQNSYAELLGVFGPREIDTIAPEIIDIQPADGSSFTTDDDILVTARASEDSTFVGAKWTWMEGLPEDLEEYTVCTNNVCTADYPLGVGFDPNEVEWDMVQLSSAPAGTYSFKFEIMDGYGQYATETITFEVVQAGEDDTADTGATDPTDGDDDGTGDDGDTEGDDDDDDGDDDDDDGDSGSDTLPADGGDDGSKNGCNCRASADAAPFGAWLLVALVAVRRRRAA